MSDVYDRGALNCLPTDAVLIPLPDGRLLALPREHALCSVAVQAMEALRVEDHHGFALLACEYERIHEEVVK